MTPLVGTESRANILSVTGTCFQKPSTGRDANLAVNIARGSPALRRTR